jgi:glycosyltransferase involved in cell wall biosynthesis
MKKEILKNVLRNVNQDYENKEIIILDDNSTDNTYKLLHQLVRAI